MVKRVFVVGVAVVTAAGCALFSEGPPENVCRGNGDCFQAQGEVCNLDTKQCEPGDGGIPTDAVDAGDASDAPIDTAAN